MSEETPLIGALTAEERAVAPANPPVQTDPAQDPEAATARIARSRGRGLIDEKERAATLKYLKALAQAGQRRQVGSLTTSVSELKRLKATHGAAALSEITDGTAARN